MLYRKTISAVALLLSILSLTSFVVAESTYYYTGESIPTVLNALPISDLNQDGKVTITDIVIVVLAFGSVPSDPNWNPIADLNNDGRVSILDVVRVTIDFGRPHVILDSGEPTYDYGRISDTRVNMTVTFAVNWTDNQGLSGFIFGWNNTGTWQNDTWRDPWFGEPQIGWSNVMKTITTTEGSLMKWQIWCNDTSNNWATTDTQYFIVGSNSSGYWIPRRPLPNLGYAGLQYASLSVIDGKIYCVGGRKCANDPNDKWHRNGRYNFTFCYDPETDTWTRKADCPIHGDAGATGVVDGKMYVISAFTQDKGHSGETWCYDPSTDTWTERSPISTPRWDSVGLVLTDSAGNDVIYVIGGCNDGTNYNKTEVYCPNNYTWITKADMNDARAKLAGSVHDGKIYVFSSVYNEPKLKTGEVYDPATNTWEYISNSSEYVLCASQVSVTGRIRLLRGGSGYDPDRRPNHWYYSPSNDSYVEMTDFGFVDRFAVPLEAPVIGNSCYVIGGGSNGYAQKGVYEFVFPPN